MSKVWFVAMLVFQDFCFDVMNLFCLAFDSLDQISHLVTGNVGHQLVGRSASFVPDYNIAITIRGIAMKFCTDIHGPQRMKPTDFGDPLTFPLGSPRDWHMWFWVKCLNNYWTAPGESVALVLCTLCVCVCVCVCVLQVLGWAKLRCHYVDWEHLASVPRLFKLACPDASVLVSSPLTKLWLLSDGLPWNLVQTFMSPSGWIVITLLIPELFIQHHHQVQIAIHH